MRSKNHFPVIEGGIINGFTVTCTCGAFLGHDFVSQEDAEDAFADHAAGDLRS